METNNTTRQNDAIGTLGDMIDTGRSLMNVTLVEKTAVGGSVGILGIALFVFAVFVLLFGSIGVAWWIGDTMSNMKAGFFIVGGAWLVVLIVVLLLANPVILPRLRDLIVRRIYEQV